MSYKTARPLYGSPFLRHSSTHETQKETACNKPTTTSSTINRNLLLHPPCNSSPTICTITPPWLSPPGTLSSACHTTDTTVPHTTHHIMNSRVVLTWIRWSRAADPWGNGSTNITCNMPRSNNRSTSRSPKYNTTITTNTTTSSSAVMWALNASIYNGAHVSSPAVFPTHAMPKSTSLGFLKLLARPFKQEVQLLATLPPTVLGGGAEQQQLFVELQHGSPSKRVAAVRRFTEIMKRQALSSVPEVWTAAADLLDSSEAHARTAAAELLLVCILVDNDSSSVTSRLTYFQAITGSCRVAPGVPDPNLLVFVAALSALTVSGLSIQDFVIGQTTPLPAWLARAVASVAGTDCEATPQLLILVALVLRQCLSLIKEDELAGLLDATLALFSHSPPPAAQDAVRIITKYTAISQDQWGEATAGLCKVYPQSDPHLRQLTEDLFQHCLLKDAGEDGDPSTARRSMGVLALTKCLPGPSAIGAIEVLTRVGVPHLLPSDPGLSVVVRGMFRCTDNRETAPLVLEFIEELVRVHGPALALSFQYWNDPSISLIALAGAAASAAPDGLAPLVTYLQQHCELRSFSADRSAVVGLLVQHHRTLLDAHALFGLTLLSREPWGSVLSNKQSYIDAIVSGLLTRSPEVAMKALDTLRRWYDTTCVVDGNGVDSAVMKQVFSVVSTAAVLVQTHFCRLWVEAAANTPEDTFARQVGHVEKYITTGESAFSVLLAQTLSRLFCELHVVNGTKAVLVYNTLCTVAAHGCSVRSAELMLAAVRLLLTIRCTWDGWVFLRPLLDVLGMATAFGHIGKERPESALWWFPEEVWYIPANRMMVLRHLVRVSGDGASPTIDPGRMALVVVAILEQCPHWEAHSYVFTHTCQQLLNMVLYSLCLAQVSRIRALVCNGLQNKWQLASEVPQGWTKADGQVACVRMLSPLLGYHKLFAKHESDQVVYSLMCGLLLWDKTAVPCINALTVCVYELPHLVRKYLSAILVALQTRVSSPYANAHVVEFLTSLAQQENITAELGFDDVKRVLGIAFKYTQYCRDHESAASSSTAVDSYQAHGVAAEVELAPLTVLPGMLAALWEYLKYMAHWLVTMWFLSLPLGERAQLAEFVVRNVRQSATLNEAGGMDRQSVALIDMVRGSTYADEVRVGKAGPIATSGPTKHFVTSTRVVSVSTNPASGESEVTVRRPASTSRIRITRLLSTPGPSHYLPEHVFLEVMSQSGVAEDVYALDVTDPSTKRALAMLDRIPVSDFHKVGVMYVGPGQLLEQQVLGNQSGSASYQRFLLRLGMLVQLQGCTDVYTGGLDTEGGSDGEFTVVWWDRLVQMVFHATTLMPAPAAHDTQCSMKKRHVGNNYVNVFYDESGALEFDFNLIKLQLLFMHLVISPHTWYGGMVAAGATGLPHCLDPYEVEAWHQCSESRFYRVRLYRRSGVPGVLSASHFKVVSEEQLPAYVRHLAMMANTFAEAWHSQGGPSSCWARRVEQIETLHGKHGERVWAGENYAQGVREAAADPPTSPTVARETKSTTMSFLGQLEKLSEGA